MAQNFQQHFHFIINMTRALLNAVYWHVMMELPITQDKDFSSIVDTLNYHYTKAVKGIDLTEIQQPDRYVAF